MPPVITWSFPEETELREDLPPVEIAIQGFPLPPADSDDYWPLVLLGQLLGGGTVDLLEEDLVERERKALLAGTELFFLRRGGAVIFYSAALPYRRKATAFRVMERSRERLSRLDWLTDERLAAAKRSLRRQDLTAAYYPAERAAQIGKARWWLGDELLAFQRAEHIESVTRDDVAAVYRRYVAEPRPIRLYLEPERVPLIVRLFGWVYPLVHR